MSAALWRDSGLPSWLGLRQNFDCYEERHSTVVIPIEYRLEAKSDGWWYWQGERLIERKQAPKPVMPWWFF